MKSKPSLSIMVVTHDRPQEVARALRSCAAYFPDAEVLLLDNGEQAVPPEVASIHPGTKYIRLTPKDTLNISRNIAYDRFTGDYIFNLDDDAFIDMPGFAERLFEVLSKYPQAGIVSCNLFEDGAALFSGKTRYSSFFFEGACAYSRAMLDAGIRFDERQGMYGENLNVLFQVLSKGFECVFVPDLLVHHQPKYEQRPKAYNDLRLRNHVAQSSATFFRFFGFASATVLAVSTVGLHLLQSLRQPRKCLQVLIAGCKFWALVPGMLRSKVPLSKAVQSRYLYCGMYDIEPGGYVPKRYGVGRYLFDKLRSLRKTLQPWNPAA